MSEILQHRSNFAQSALLSLLTFTALVLLAAVLAYWTWEWFAPRPAPRARAIEAPSRVEAAYGLFGQAPSSGNVAAPTGLAIRLLGVVAAGGGKSSYAVVQVDANKILAAREGTDLAPGIRLTEVRAGEIVFERNGTRETLALPEKAGRARDAGAVPPPSAPAEAPVRRGRD